MKWKIYLLNNFLIQVNLKLRLLYIQYITYGGGITGYEEEGWALGDGLGTPVISPPGAVEPFSFALAARIAASSSFETNRP